MADHRFAEAESWAELAEAHDRFVEDYNAQAHWAHREREDGRRSPAEVLGFLSGVRHREEELRRAFFSSRFTRTLDALGYPRFRHWRVYGKEALAGREAALWLATESLTLEHEGAPLSCYEVRVEAETGELRSVGRPRLFGTSAVVAQPKLFGLDALGEAGWLKALRLEGYAPRRPRGGWRCRRRSSPTRRTSSVPEAEGLRAPGGHGELLGRAVARLQQDERVVALILGGSLARGSADLYSDVDLYGVVRDGAFDAVLAERDAVTEVVGSRLFAFDVDPVSGGSTDRIVLYGGPDGEPIKFDFMYLKESDLVPAPKWAGCAVLEDEGGRVGAVVARSEGLAPPPPKPDELGELNQKFWTLCWYVFGKIVRGELWEAIDGLHNIRSLALVPLLDWAAGRPHEGYRRLEAKLDAETASRLKATLSPLEPEALYAALRAEVELFRGLRATVFDRHGVGFDLAPEETLEAEMNRLWAARGGR